MIEHGDDFQLIDVREDYETDIASIGGELIPMGEIIDTLHKLSKEKKVILYCRTGHRSAVVAIELEKHHGFSNVYNLKGGLYAWSDEIDSSVTKY